MRTNWEWEQFGEDIRRTVQDAVDSRDFRRLNQTITDTVNSALHGFTGGMRGSRQGYRYQQNTYQNTQGRGTQNGWQNLDLNQLKRPTLYAKMRGRKIAGMVMAITGYSFAVCLLIGSVITGVTGMLMGAGVGVSVAVTIQMIFLIVFTVLGAAGSRMMCQVKRFQTYIEELHGREYGNIKDLAQRMHKKEKFVVKDLEAMIRKGWFLQGYLDDQKVCLMTSKEAYDQYRELMAQAKQQKMQEQEKKDQQKAWFLQGYLDDQKVCLMTSKEAYDQYRELMAQAKQQKMQEQEKKDQQKADADRRAGLDPKVQEVIEAGNRYIRKIRECNDAIPGEVVSEKMSRMELLTKRIFERVEQNPEAVTDIRRLMEYYLPTAVKLLEAYEELDAQPVQGENILSSKKEIEDTLDTLNMAFEKLLDDLFQDTAWDVSSDISVLKTMLAQEGLTENDFSTGGK